MKIFTDAIAALEKLGGLIRGAAQLPKRRRQSYLSAVGEAFSLLQTALLLVETKLGDLLHIQDDWELTDDQKRRRFIQELANLDNTEQWLAMEREVALCRSLRVTSRELGDAFGRLVDRGALEDQTAIYQLIDSILERERMLAAHISTSLESLAAMAEGAQSSNERLIKAWRAVSRQRRVLSEERRSLIDAERRFLESV